MNQLILQNQQTIQQIRELYKAFNTNPTQAIHDACANNPMINELIQKGKNPNELFEMMLKQYGMSREDFMNLLS